ncbi:hypothetical protein GUJ93_ZPchr0004g38877 [Zizania palustris]|uniref:FACT complex subunit n=1 Tax=Zizania palustris TaxID=103762 RepID=A0A8J5VYL6_ZIZPA|nr:hypothetical protein GUJ93_ZPchr0004g38877 [Zizania palustris]
MGRQIVWLSVQLTDITNGFSELFAVKDASEITCVKKAAYLTSSVMKILLCPKLEKVIDEERKVTHSSLMDDTEKAILDPLKVKVKLKAENVDICYPPVFQSGGKFDLKPGASSNDDHLYYDSASVIICAIGSRYGNYCSNIARTFLIDATPTQSKVYETLLKAHEAAIEALKPGNRMSAVEVNAKEALPPTKATLRSDNQEMSKEELRRQHQAELARQKNEETARRLAGVGSGSGDGRGNSRSSNELVAYKNVNDVPYARELVIQVDQKNEAVLLPIYGTMVPFHVSTVKSVTSHQDNRTCTIRIFFNVPGMPFSNDSNLKSQGAIYLKEITFRSKDPRHSSEVVQQIKTLRRQVASRESERAERATLVTQEKLQLASNRKQARGQHLILMKLKKSSVRRDRKNRINMDFQNFVNKVNDHWSQPQFKGMDLEFDIPLRELGFHGVPYKASAFIIPTSTCLVELIENPFLVVTLGEIEIVHLERVGFGTKNFDMAIVFKDFKKDVLRIDSIPSTSLDAIRNGLTLLT